MDGTVPVSVTVRVEKNLLGGEDLYGDDFNIFEIERWYREEEHGYYNLVQTYDRYEYGYHQLNIHDAYRYFAGREFSRCLAFGCSNGNDVMPIAKQVAKFIAVEPAQQWWRTEIGGTPAEYLKPSIMGDIPVDDGTCDLAVCLGVLHHIPNVSYVLKEIHRVIAPGGLFFLREPISSMGDWRKPRRGLTKNERGLPPDWLQEQFDELGFRIVRKRFCMFAPLTLIARVLTLNAPFDHRCFLFVDQVLSSAMKWNQHYHRDKLLTKIAPTTVVYLLQKQ